MMPLEADMERLATARLLPRRCEVELRVPEPGPALRDRYRACLLGGAIGDALGRPVEGRRRHRILDEYPDGLRDFVTWRGWSGGPIGTITDDTQLTIVIAEWLCRDLPRGSELAKAILAWGEIGRGIGSATGQALQRLDLGEPWWRAGTASAGNGGAMRAAPYGLRHAGQVEEIRTWAALGTTPTHADISAVASAIVQAVAVSECLAQTWPLDPADLLERLVAVIEDLDLPALAHRGTGVRRTLVQRIEEVHDLLGAAPERVFDHFYNGAFVLETTPVVLWLLLDRGEDPEEALVTAVMGGGDADTNAAILGNLLGALHGTDAFPIRWTGDELEEREHLIELADRLYDVRWPTAGHPLELDVTRGDEA
jgi:ADP-ribosylglycohydrolase